MIIAVATEGKNVAEHFGRCSKYTLYEIEGNAVKSKTEVSNPGHKPGFLPRFLAEKGVEYVICGGMGPRAQQLFAEHGIGTMVGVTGNVDEVIDQYLFGNLKAGDSFCNHGDGHGHGCG